MGNKKAIVTGGSRGIGSGIVRKLASEGYDVAFSYHSAEEEARVLAEEMKAAYGVNCYYYQAGLHLKGVPAELFQKAVEDLGGLDLMVCNAGMNFGGSIMELDEEGFEKVISLDYKCYLLMSGYASKYMVEHDTKGSIVFVTSTHSQRAYPYDAVYGSLKAGLNRAVESLACELGNYGIRVNAVAPGYTKIRNSVPGGGPFWEHYDEHCAELGARLPLNRIGYPADIANAVYFLASDDAKYITGITVKVDGGLILPGMPESDRLESNVRIWGFKEHYGFVRPKPEEKK